MPLARNHGSSAAATLMVEAEHNTRIAPVVRGVACDSGVFDLSCACHPTPTAPSCCTCVRARSRAVCCGVLGRAVVCQSSDKLPACVLLYIV